MQAPGPPVHSRAAAAAAPYGSVDGRRPILVEDTLLKRPVNYRSGWTGPQFLAAALFLAYSAPIIVSYQLGMDPDAAFWMGRIGVLAVGLVPWFVVLVVLYVVWLDWRRHYNWMIILGGVLPAIFLCAIGAYYMNEGHFLETHLNSGGCSSHEALPLKGKLQEAYDEAHGIFNACSARLLMENGGNALPRRPLLQVCREFQQELILGPDVVSTYYVVVGVKVVSIFPDLEQARNTIMVDGGTGRTEPSRMIVEVRNGMVHSIPYAVGGDISKATGTPTDPHETNKMVNAVKQHIWESTSTPPPPPAWPLKYHLDKDYLYDYLATTEANMICGGFCHPGPTLWNPVQSGGACGQYVALKMKNISREGQLLFWSSAVAGVLALVLLSLIRPLFQPLGYA